MSITHRVTIAEYKQMIASGKFDGPESAPMELIDGELRTMAPIGPPHAELVTWLIEWGVRQVPPKKIRVRPQCPVELPRQASVPEPDLAWVKARSYLREWPQPEFVLLLIEVADSSLAFDLETKRDLYAEAGIQEYWVVDVNNFCIHVFRDPLNGVYQKPFVCELHDWVSPLAMPKLKLEIAELFGESA